MIMTSNEFLEYTRWMSEEEYFDFIEYASNEHEETPIWLAEFRDKRAIAGIEEYPLYEERREELTF